MTSRATMGQVASTEHEGPPGGRVTIKLMYRVPEAAAMLRISGSALYELIRSRRVCSVTVGRTRLISHRALAEYIEQLEENAT